MAEPVIVYEGYTCQEYDAESHIPVMLTSYFNVSSPGAFLWFNMTYVREVNVTIHWFFPNGTIYFVDDWLVPEEEQVTTLPSVDGVSYLPIAGEAPSSHLGRWRVDFFIDDVLHFSEEFNIIDKDGPDWNYYAEIVDVIVPETVFQDENFTVEVVVFYDFENYTLLTPGLWDPVTGDLIVEDFDEVVGEDTRTYSFEVMGANATGTFIIDAAAFYLYDDEWFIDEGGLVSFEVSVVERDEDWFIPGFPVEAVFAGLGLSMLSLYKRSSKLREH